jgi:hypothetical protein
MVRGGGLLSGAGGLGENGGGPGLKSEVMGTSVTVAAMGATHLPVIMLPSGERRSLFGSGRATAPTV